MKLLISLFLLIFPINAYSACGVDCMAEPTCSELGYSKDINCPSGYIKCPFNSEYIWCKSYTCQDGRYELEPLSLKGYQCSAIAYHGLSCYDCKCQPTADCKWTISNAGQASLSGECCNGSYSSCTPSCPSNISIPKNSDPVYSTCTACGVDNRYISDFTCIEGYERSNNECVVKACELGYSTQYQSVADCGTTGALGYSYDYKSKSGELLCGKCEIRQCPIGETVDVSGIPCSAEDCTGIGCEHAKTSNYEGETPCYEKSCTCNPPSACTWVSANAASATLSDLCCNGNYSTCTPTCAWVEVPENAKATDSCAACGYTKPTAWECNEGYEKSSDGKSCKVAQCAPGSATVAAGCGNGTGKDIGWSITDTQVGTSGTYPCYACQKNECISGDTNSNVNSCPYPSTKYADKVKNQYYSGDDACYDCTCDAPNDCNWESGTEQYGTLSELCCNGKYATCTTKCVEVTVPEHAHVTAECTGCNKTVSTAWACDAGYVKSSDGKSCEPAACEGFPISGSCPAHGSCSECLSGEDTKYKLNSCDEGYVVNGNVCDIAQCNANCKTKLEDCGTSGGWDFGEDCNLSGAERCKTCVAKTCAEGDTNSDVNSCKYPSNKYASKPANGLYSGNNACYKCECNPAASCQWTDENKGQASISTQCCDGKYETCVPNCVDKATVPENGKAIKENCTACGETTQIIVDFECNVGYAKEGNKCVVVTCNTGCAADLGGCGNGTGGNKGWQFGTNCNMSGTTQCKTCVAKTCTSGNTNSNVSDCTSLPSTQYATKVENGYYSGDSKCYDCNCNAPTDKCKWNSGNAGAANLGKLCCNGMYETCTSTCVAVTIPANAHSTETCSGCGTTIDTAWACNDGYVKNSAGTGCQVAQCNSGCKTSAANCGTSGEKGWSLGENCNLSGTTQCKTCVAKTCSTGNPNSNVSNCTMYPSTKYATKVANGSFNGDNPCYNCECNAPASCKWTENNANSANVSNMCCNGYYETCVSTCAGVTVPANATSTGTCTGCGQTVDTGWKCNTGWTKNAAGTACVEAPCDGYNIAGSCPTHGTCSECTSGSSTKYRLDSCDNGYVKNSTSTACIVATCNTGCATSVDSCGTGVGKANGYTLGSNCNLSGTTQCKTCVKKSCPNDTNTAWVSSTSCNTTKGSSGWQSSPTNYYNGDDRCYSCTCNAPSTCKWTSSNIGTATLGGLCCNGKYDTCTSSCKKITVPENGTGTTQCTGCGETVYTDFKCNTGYKKNPAGTACIEALCDDGSATKVADCGTSGATGWELGTTVTGTSGGKNCYKCNAKTCSSGDTSSAVSSCPYPSTSYASKPANGNYNGDNKCYTCQCDAPASCKWTSSNKDSGTLSNLCCNGNYATCTSTCKDTVTVPSNATAVTSSCKGCGTTVSIKTGWNCNDGYTKNAAGTGCQVATCESGCVLDIASCGTKSIGSAGWTLGTNCNMSGTQQCKKCTAKSCPSDTNTAWSSANACASAKGSIGWESAATPDYNGDSACYKCTCSYTSANCPYTDSNKGTATISDKCCNGQYKTCKSTCASVTVPTNAHATATCTGCGQTVNTAWACNDGYTKNGNACDVATCNSGCATDVSKCGSKGSAGWTLGANCNLSGSAQCKTCTKRTCETGCSTSYTSADACKTANSWPTSTGASISACGVSNGDTTCYKCSCNCDSSTYKWTSSNAGTATLSNQCCDGTYKTCTSTCKEITVPSNAKGTTQCTGCSKTVYTAWECNPGFTKNSAGTGCVAASCPTGSATTAAGCKTTGSAGYKLTSTVKGYNGTTPCYECVSNGCSSGDTNSAVSSCGYSSTTHATKSANGDYDGENKCYSCSCDDSKCKWTNSNKGNASISTLCCNGKYQTCTSTCKDTVTVPANATGTKTTCTACEQSYSVTTGWTCNTGYVKNSAGTACVAATCCAGSTSYNSADACKNAMGYPSTTGVYYDSAGCTSGGSTCYTCSCSCSSSTYKWDSSNVGTYGKVSGTQCCNGKYSACVKNSNFPTSISYPDNSTPSYTTYTACNSTISEQVVTGWSCNTCYTKSGSICVASDCTSGYATSASKCYSKGSAGWTLDTSSSGCSGVSTCYKCVAKSCPSGYATSAGNCGTGGTKGWTLGSTVNATYNGDTACKNCVAKSCPSGYATSAANCGSGGASGWTLGSAHSTIMNGNSSCYQCIAQTCPSGTATSAAGCGTNGIDGWKTGTEIKDYAGNTPCYQCNAKDCDSSYQTSAANCGTTGTAGWIIDTSNKCYAGATTKYKCVALTCESGTSTSYTTADSCKSAKGWPTTTGGKSDKLSKAEGNSYCYKCSCSCDSATYKWDSSNKGTATLSNQCCNGKYKTCTSTCSAVTVPANATSTGTCTGCGTTVNTGWKCNANYCSNGSGCTSLCSTSTYAYYSGNKPANSTLSGSTCISPRGTSQGSCGTSYTNYTSFTCNSGYCKSGSACYTVCSSSTYPYTSAPSNGTLSGSSCTGYTGTSASTCSGSSAKRYSSFTCNSGYVKVGSTCQKIYASCTDYNSSYKTTNSGYCGCTKVSGIYNSSGTELTCYSGCTSLCSTSTYAYYSGNKPANSTLSGSTCTSPRGTSAGTCGTSYTNYSSFTCNSGYCKSGSSCVALCNTSTYPYYSAPANGKLSGSTCVGYRGTSGGSCGTSYTNYSSFTCNTGYCKSGSSCVACACPSGSSTTYTSAEACKNAMGYSSTTGVSYSKNGSYSGSSPCYTCSCNCDSSTYKWNSSNKGTANLTGTVCCDGKYSGCSETCADVSVPTNATSASTCTGCGVTYNTSWNPKSGYCRL